jgi:hypothetical protein
MCKCVNKKLKIKNYNNFENYNNFKSIKVGLFSSSCFLCHILSNMTTNDNIMDSESVPTTFFDFGYTSLSFEDFIRNLLVFTSSKQTATNVENLILEYFTTNTDHLSRISQSTIVSSLEKVDFNYLNVIKNHFCSIVNNNQQPEKKLVPVRRTKKNLKGFSEDIYYLIKIVAEQLFNNDALLKKVFKSTDLNEQCDQIADLYCEIE